MPLNESIPVSSAFFTTLISSTPSLPPPIGKFSGNRVRRRLRLLPFPPVLRRSRRRFIRHDSCCDSARINCVFLLKKARIIPTRMKKPQERKGSAQPSQHVSVLNAGADGAHQRETAAIRGTIANHYNRRNGCRRTAPPLPFYKATRKLRMGGTSSEFFASRKLSIGEIKTARRLNFISAPNEIPPVYLFFPPLKFSSPSENAAIKAKLFFTHRAWISVYVIMLLKSSLIGFSPVLHTFLNRFSPPPRPVNGLFYKKEFLSHLLAAAITLVQVQLRIVGG